MPRNRPIYTPKEGPPQDGRPNPEIYSLMGEENIFQMLQDFYKELENSEIRTLFPEDMQAASKKSAAFFVFLLGGPPLYQQMYGPPMMRQKHLPFIIDEKARQVWLDCFSKVLSDAEHKYHFPIQYKEEFFEFLKRFSSWMVNTKM